MTAIRARLTSRIEEAMTRLEGGDPEREKATLLVVDDEKGPRESLRMILSPQHRVLTASDANEALEILAEQPVDAVTIDLNMPGMKGDELVRRVRSAYPQIEVVVITGYSSVESAVDGLRHGIFDYLTKPFDVVQVSNTARRALARRDSRRRMVDFLHGIGEVLGEDASTESASATLAADPELQLRIREAVQRSAARSADDGAEENGDELLESISTAIEGREPQRVGHARRVAFLAGLIAERMGLTAERREVIRVAALLHDVGRIASPAAETSDDTTPVDETHHVDAGAELVASLGYPSGVVDAVRHHHHRYDGAGATPAIERGDIPLASRVIAVADAFDVLTRGVGEAEPCSPAEAIAALRGRAGRDLDPEILKELISIAETGASSSGPLLDLCFVEGKDPADTIASATAWLEIDR